MEETFGCKDLDPTPEADAHAPNHLEHPPDDNVQKDQACQKRQADISQGQPYGLLRDPWRWGRDTVNGFGHGSGLTHP